METENNVASNGVIQQQQQTHLLASADTTKECPQRIKREASWPSVLFYIHLNILGLYGIFIMFTNASFLTILFSKFNKNRQKVHESTSVRFVYSVYV